MAIKNPFAKKTPIAQAIELNAEQMESESNIWNAVKRTLRLDSGGLFGYSADGKRDYNALYGYGGSLNYADFYSMYKRGGIANTVVQKVSKACWRDVPKIMVGEDEVHEDFIQELKNRGLFKALEKADTLNRIGTFSVLLIGLADSLLLDQPLGSASNLDDMYFNAYSEDGTTVSEWDMDRASPRYGMPIMYEVQTTSFGGKTKGIQLEARKVHFSRIVHLAEGSLDNPFEGCSSLEAPWNALTDKEKARGGSAEAYFRNARQKFALEAVKDAKLNPDLSVLQDEVEAFTNNQQDFMRLKNMTAKVMQPGMASPRDIFDVAVEEVSGVTGIPIRVLTGKGGGQLAGSEDRASWNSVVNDRQDSECSDYLSQALAIYDEAGLIDMPDNYEIVWPVQPALNEKERAETVNTKASAAKQMAETVAMSGEEADVNDIFEAAGFDDLTIDTSEIEDTENEPS